MIRLRVLAAGIVGTIVLSAGGAVAVPPSAVPLSITTTAERFVPGELIVRFRAREPATKAAALRRLGAVLGSDIGATGYTRVKLGAGDDVTDALARYRNDPAVDTVQFNYRYLPQLLPNDRHFAELWALKNTGQHTGPFPTHSGITGNDMGLEAAWDTITDCSSTIIAVIDTGINYTHADLAANMWDGTASGYPHHGFDFVHDDSDPMPADGDGHGTHVAGIIAAVGNNGAGTTGVCWRARIMALRAMDASGGRTDTVIEAVYFAVQHGARILNLSLGGDGRDDAFATAIEYARQQGAVVIAAGGNGKRDIDQTRPFYPCSFTSDNIICVAALDQAYTFTWFSNYGARSVDVGAPGTNVLSARPGAWERWFWGGGWQSCGGALTTPAVCATGNYANDSDDRLWRLVDLSASNLLGAGVTGSYRLKTADGSPPWPYTSVDPDALTAGYNRDGGDPFAAGRTTVYIPDTADVAYFALSLHDCLTPSCNVVLRFASDGSGTDSGPRVFASVLRLAQRGADAYEYAEGTSMATAYTAGVAALVWAFNPNYTYIDVVNAVKHGGDEVENLRSATVTGRAVDAMEALRYIAAPHNVTLTSQ